MNFKLSLLILSTLLSCIFGQSVYTLTDSTLSSMQWNSTTSQKYNLNQKLFKAHQISSYNNGALQALVSNSNDYLSVVAIDTTSGKLKQLQGMASPSEYQTSEFFDAFYDSSLNLANLLFIGSNTSDPNGPTNVALLSYNFETSQVQTTWLGPKNGTYRGTYDQGEQLYFVVNVVQAGYFQITVLNATTGHVVEKNDIYASVDPTTEFALFARNGGVFVAINLGSKIQMYFLNVNVGTKVSIATVNTPFTITGFDIYLESLNIVDALVYLSVYTNTQSSIYKFTFESMVFDTVYTKTAVLLNSSQLVYIDYNN
ncbi:hypothetical protein CYY_001709 [Polysphondylium violaceum]|uniref:Uncharacterized protein n=1 Tax=Polysphondylium violaceum TaxID=133409 RepID=A0A8J4Q0N2_9MYCE|nr:hypothetical protein CYY_001709 [Polysphondylium violaceum]